MTTEKTTTMTERMTGGGLGAAIAWSHLGAGVAFAVLALLRLAGDHVGLTHLARSLTGGA